MSSTLVHKNAADTYGWAKLVALKNFAFVHIDDPVIRAAVRYKAMDRKPLQKRMISLVGVVDVKIMHELSGEKFALVFDVFTDAAEHAIVIFTTTKKGIRFLAFSHFLDEAAMTAAEHIEFLDMILDHYSLDIANMVAIVADNMETIKAISC
ncbi:hypothetical protein GN244_ATG16304 [Phytophthora infestans]|uniref:DUF659 domain-containing protein n=1 Tax=Phytophthora infestans TaxID=4787 RepID=A0A833WFA0_PHYIN|nr:hypothetical protein GN244_ATG16304 [Phytophthora infestans]KAF4129897.1 hypothetical protein GN958_ATG20900 [Phytophthora infestans]